ncbi:MAG: glucosamine-6-phosphate deaminase [Erysipelotrichaceae bacterium]|nr:glucosamine-6-phosphate deaminase [Erysipelotrichaceae bacterium]
MKIVISTKTKASNEAANLISDFVANNPSAVLGFATGSSPKGVYRRMIKRHTRDGITYADVKAFNLDEYLGVFPREQSYRYYMSTRLYEHVDIKQENTFFPSESNLREFDQMIDDAGGIDIQIIGVGTNGHIGFNEPGTSETSTTHITYLTAETMLSNSRFFDNLDNVPNKAITMGLATIMKAKKIIFLAFGENKAEAVKRLVEAKKFDINWPLTVLWNHPDITLYLDEGAASLIKKQD